MELSGEHASEAVLSQPASRLFSNSVAMGAANLLSRGIGYVYIILMARRLDARYLGMYGVLLTASMLVELVSNLGLDKILVREIASSPASIGKGLFWAALPIRVLMAFVSATVAWVLLLTFLKQQLVVSSLSIALYFSAIFPVVAARNCESFLTAHERLVAIAISQLAEKLVIFGGAILLVTGVLSFTTFLCCAPVASAFRLTVIAAATARNWARQTVATRPEIRRLLRQATELLSVEILALVYFRSDTFVLAKFGGMRETGVYQITYKIFDFCLSLFSGFLQAAFPRLVRDKNRDSVKSMLTVGTGLVAIPAAVIILGRRWILGAVGPTYLSGSPSLVWLMLTVPLVYITTTVVNVAISAGRVRLLVVLAGLMVASNVSLTILLIPKYSITGAAFATFACELLSSVFLAPFLIKSLQRQQRLT